MAGVTDDEIKECFDVFDKDKDGKISAEELGTVIRALGKNPLQSEIAEMIKDNGGEASLINFSTFKDFFKRRMKKPHDQEKEMREAFKAMDKDGQGLILEAELRQILTTLGEPLENDEVEALLRDIETNADGEINYDQFVDLLIS